MSNEENKLSAIQAEIVTINNAKLEPVKLEGHNPFMLKHDTMGAVGLESFSEKPYRVQVAQVFCTSRAIAQYIKDFKKENTAVFSNSRNAELSVVFDYHHKDGSPEWCGHRASLKLEFDADYESLRNMNGRWLSQQYFVNALADLAGFISTVSYKVGQEPKEMSKADFVELVRELKGMTQESTEGRVGTSSVSGASTYTSKITAKGRELPDFLTFRLPVFRGENPIDHPFRIEARHDDGIELRISLIRPDKVREAAFDAIVSDVAEQAEVSIYGL